MHTQNVVPNVLEGKTLPASGPNAPQATVSTPRTIAELISIKARELPNHPILGYPEEGVNYVEYDFAKLELLASKAARIYATRLPIRKSSRENERVVALLGPSTIDFVVSTLALTQLGFTVMFLSTRLSDGAYHSLLSSTRCQTVVVDPTLKKGLLEVQRTLKLLLVDIISKNEYDNPEVFSAFPEPNQELNLNEETHKTCWIIHSSGTTSFPKPIYQTHKTMLRNYEQHLDMSAFMTLPLFHAGGLTSLFRAITSSKKLYMHNANLPITRQNLIQVLQEHDLDAFFAVPYTLRLVCETIEGVETLAKMRFVVFGGSACPRSLGDRLVEAGVNLISYYGSTEMGKLMASQRPDGDRAWDYLRVSDKLAPFIRWEKAGEKLYELIILDGWVSKTDTNLADGSYATRDLFEPHETLPNAWRYYGRVDDTPVMLNGEKVNPVAIEAAVRQSDLVEEAAVFGAGRSQLGILIIASDSESSMQNQVIDAVRPLVISENESLPAYAQISTDMVKVLPTGTQIPRTDKGSLIRQRFYEMFQETINDAYSELESRHRGTLVLSGPELTKFIREEISNLLSHEGNFDDDIDLFSPGIDSLHASRLRTHIIQNIQLNGNTLPQNVVYENPTIVKLVSAILQIQAGATANSGSDRIHEMEQLLAKYSQFPQHNRIPRISTGVTVVVTGATGSLGAHIVTQLAKKDDILEVICLVRAKSTESSRSRVLKSLQDRQVYNTLSPNERSKITCYASDLSKKGLGLGDEVYNQISRRVTCVIHCAWSVNFNKPLSSFELDCIAGTYNLLLLCLAAQKPTPARFNFCSSASSVAGISGSSIPESIVPFQDAGWIGYAQSKAVAEHMCKAVADQTGLEARVLRVGQVVADTEHGIWNDTEAIPLMLRAATTFGALPTLDEESRWLPVDITATVMVDISLSATRNKVFNIVNPHQFHWTSDLLPALHAAGLQFDEVDQKEWLRRLRDSNPDPVVNPTFKLIDFYHKRYGQDTQSPNSMEYDTTAAEEVSPALRNVQALDSELVKRFVTRFLQTSWNQAGVNELR